ncbi:MAG: hypothetical protein Ta2F_12710 [Termitinemataceae bacterium]|nr:MAG: hypothetical protein Ta2F_12710 [Termitinemataceae bacterium]
MNDRLSDDKRTGSFIVSYFKKCLNGDDTSHDAGWGLVNAARLLLLCCMLAYLPISVRPLFVIMNSIGEKIKINNKNGVGGASYTGSDLENVVLDQFEEETLMEGIREPEEFSATQIVTYSTYKIQPNDMIGKLAPAFGLNQDTLISVNGISNTRAIQAGKYLVIPNQEGIIHKVAGGETLAAIAEKYEINSADIVTANELFSEQILAGSNIFLPGARMDSALLSEINGDLFIWPVSSRRVTSRYGYRISPISGVRGFHSGLDIGASTGVPIRAAMSGRVISTGYSNVYGNYVVISHHSNYRTLYGHMSVIRTKPGAFVGAGERIGDVGSTGQSTGPHLHFQVYKNGVTVNPVMLMN